MPPQVPEATASRPEHLPRHRRRHGGHHLCQLRRVRLAGNDLRRQTRLLHPPQPGKGFTWSFARLLTLARGKTENQKSCLSITGAVGSRRLQHDILLFHLLPQLGHSGHHEHTGERRRSHTGRAEQGPVGLSEGSKTHPGCYVEPLFVSAALWLVHQSGRSHRPAADRAALLLPAEGRLTLPQHVALEGN